MFETLAWIIASTIGGVLGALIVNAYHERRK
jgi:hypothetical protein